MRSGGGSQGEGGGGRDCLRREGTVLTAGKVREGARACSGREDEKQEREESGDEAVVARCGFLYSPVFLSYRAR